MTDRPLLAETPAGNVLADTLRTIKATPADRLGNTVLPRRIVDAEEVDDPEVVYNVVPESLVELVGSKKRYLFGVSFPEVASVCLLQLAVARSTAAPQELIRDLVFSVFVAYTVSRDWALEYQSLHSSSVLRQFEIDGRVVDRSDPMYAKSAWVNTSKMNSTAVHLLGYMVVEAAPGGGVLSKLKTSKGTPFSDANKKTPQGLLISEGAKALDAEDRDAARKFSQEFAVLIRVVDMIMGETGSNVDDALAKAIRFKPAEF